MRNFSTISPSAKSIILMKGHTSIAYAREMAELISRPELFRPDFSNEDFVFWSKVFHFESRYLEINQLLEDLDVGSFLELSSGFNLRSLEVSNRTGLFYFDTDLPELIERKLQIVESLGGGKDDSKMKIMPLNALDESQFKQVLSKMPPGPVAIINEGLLVYFDQGEKEKLCGIIRDTLSERGGYWITSDIYVRAAPSESLITQDENTKSFSDRHNIEENKFPSFEEAQDFFEKNGFVIDREGQVDFSKISSFRYLSRSLPEALKTNGRKTERLQKSWRLRVAM